MPGAPNLPQFQSTGPLRDPTAQRFFAIPPHSNFNPQVPCGTRLTSFKTPFVVIEISIHRSLAGPDYRKPKVIPENYNFNPQVPCGTRRTQSTHPLRCSQFQSTGPLRDPTPGIYARPSKILISIHRSLAGPDPDLDLARQTVAISIHRSLAGPDLGYHVVAHVHDISIHRSLAGPDSHCILLSFFTDISIHRSLAGPDGRAHRLPHCH